MDEEEVFSTEDRTGILLLLSLFEHRVVVLGDAGIKAKVGEGEKLFGSIGSADIAEELAAQGFQLDKRIIELEQPIKAIGVYNIPVRLHANVVAEVRVWVVKE